MRVYVTNKCYMILCNPNREKSVILRRGVFFLESQSVIIHRITYRVMRVYVINKCYIILCNRNREKSVILRRGVFLDFYEVPRNSEST